MHYKTLAAAIREPEDGYLALAAAVFGPTAERPSWHDRAACAGREELPWFGRHGTPPKAITDLCAACPVADLCREDTLAWEDRVALPSGMLSGFVAGMTAGQRKAAIRERRHAHDKIDNRAA